MQLWSPYQSHPSPHCILPYPLTNASPSPPAVDPALLTAWLADYWGGWAAFVVSICCVGILTTLIGDIASGFGCTVGIKDSVTAITFVAIGTSLPGRLVINSGHWLMVYIWMGCVCVFWDLYVLYILLLFFLLYVMHGFHLCVVFLFITVILLSCDISIFASISLV